MWIKSHIDNNMGEMGGILPLWFDGAVCDFRELPKPDDRIAMNKVYAKCKTLDALKQASKPNPQTSNSTVLLLFPIYNSKN